MSELVLCVPRKNLGHEAFLENSVGSTALLISSLPNEFGFLPRSFADSNEKSSLTVGKEFPQILCYVQLVNHKGEYLIYQRKGTEKRLNGLWSIGVGGHVDIKDMGPNSTLNSLLYLGTLRELWEELSIDAKDIKGLATITDFNAIPKNLIVSNKDDVSSVHVGVSFTIQLGKFQDVSLSPEEFIDYQWLTKEEIKNLHHEDFEEWSKIIIEKF